MNENLNKIYQIRFSGLQEYRNAIWKILVKDFFSNWIQRGSAVLDLGCGYGEFINNVTDCERHAMDLTQIRASIWTRTSTFTSRTAQSLGKLHPVLLT